MRLDELSLTGFGRFRGERFDLGPGLNIIYGPNEAGKSTLQAFLLGMLYGFKKPGQRRDYAADAFRYQPWGGGEYRGSLTYTLDGGRSFRVERLFEPNRDTVRIYDADTGADLSAHFPQDRRKELTFAEQHLGLDQEAFRSTAWVGQMAVGRVGAGRELLSRVANLQESGREDLSVKAALAYLEEQVKAIGTERAAGKPYGRALKAMSEKRDQLERAEAAREEMRGWEARQAELQAVLAELDDEVLHTRAELDRALLAEAEGRLRRAEEAGRRTRELRAQAAALSQYAAFPVDGLSRLRQLQAEAAEASDSAAAWRERLGALEGRREVGGGGGGMVWAILALACLAACVAALVWLGPVVAAGLAAAAALCGVLWVRAARAGAVIRQEAEAETREARRRADSAGDRARRLATEVAALLDEAGVADAEAFADACAAHHQWQRASAEADTLEAGLVSLLDGQTLETVTAEVTRLRAQASTGPVSGRSGACLREELRRLEARRADQRARLSDVTARLETALRDVPDIASLRGELAALAEEKEGLEGELAALELARATISEVAGEMHREFAPRLNEAMARVAAQLTGGRYAAVRVDQEAAIRVLTGTDRTAEVDALSAGTADQVYLAFRLALLDLLTAGEERVPLLLDDPFVQYDDQ
ncbi:MAG TPA: AAA family ATPase, partial [Symbiobacteriaceae bacterium]|nr:AAA family ATPase [Symbiobacteriaceae bacterium]